MNLCFSFLLEYLVVCVLYMCLQVWINFQPQLSNVSFYDILVFKKDINVIYLTLKDITCLQVSPLLKKLLFFLPPHKMLTLSNRFCLCL